MNSQFTTTNYSHIFSSLVADIFLLKVRLGSCLTEINYLNSLTALSVSEVSSRRSDPSIESIVNRRQWLWEQIREIERTLLEIFGYTTDTGLAMRFPR